MTTTIEHRDPDQPSAPELTDRPALVGRLQDEADLCRNEGADDVAALLDEAAESICGLEQSSRTYFLERNSARDALRRRQRLAEMWQGGMSNEELLAAWKQKLPGIEPTDRELTSFALGVEVGASLNPRWKVITWSSLTDRTFLTKDEAIEYVRDHAKEDDWHIEQRTFLEP